MTGPTQSKPALASLHDVELARLASSGERQAFGELARRHGSAVRALLRRLGAQAALADDLAQDAFLIAYERIAEYRGEGAFGGWIKRIAARLYIKRWRSRLTLDPMPDAPEAQAEGVDGEGEAARRLDLDAALETLSSSERLCVALCYGAGLSHAEAAETLHLPLGTVKSHVKRGLYKLKHRLASQNGSSAETGRRTYG